MRWKFASSSSPPAFAAATFIILRGVWVHPKPVILGHEACGIIEAVGPRRAQVAHRRKGRAHFHALLRPLPLLRESAAACLCEEVARAAAQGTMWDDTTRFFEKDGKPIHHLSLVSSFCEYTVVPHNGAIRIDAESSPEEACLLGCGAMAGIGAALNTAQVRPGDSVAVFGCGGVGLSVVQGAKLCNALADRRRRRAARKGSRSAPVRRHAFRQCRGRRSRRGGARDHRWRRRFHLRGDRPDGDGRALLRATCRAGTTVLIGQPTENAVAGFPPYWIAQDENRVIGSSYGSTRPMIDFPKVLRLVKHGHARSSIAGLRSVAIRADQRGHRAGGDGAGQPHGAPSSNGNSGLSTLHGRTSSMKEERL